MNTYTYSYLMQNTFGVKEGVAKDSRIIPGSECMKRSATTRSDTGCGLGLAY